LRPVRGDAQVHPRSYRSSIGSITVYKIPVTLPTTLMSYRPVGKVARESRAASLVY
jgi:hypothetical protein